MKSELWNMSYHTMEEVSIVCEEEEKGLVKELKMIDLKLFSNGF